MKIFSKKTEGFSLLELALAVGLFMIFAVGLASTAIGGHLTGLENAKAAKANALLVETWEALSSLRHNNWSKMTSGTHGLAVGGGHWEFSGNSDTVDGFTRVITISDVRRDDSDDIVTSGGELDPDIKLISLELSWIPSSGQARSMQFQSYLTNYINPIETEWPIPPPDPPPEP